MSLYYEIEIIDGTAPGPYNIYYDSIDASNIATLYPSGDPASGITYTELTTGGGVVAEVPDDTVDIFLYNTSCDNYEQYSTLLTNIESYYKFDETSGTSVSDSHGTNDGVLNQGSFGSGGKINYGFNCNGTDGTFGASFGNNFNPISTISYNFWVKPDSITEIKALLNKVESNANFDNAFLLSLTSTGKIYVVLGGTDGNNRIYKTTTNNGLLPIDTWTMITLTYDGSNNASGMKLYLNGIEITSFDITSDDYDGTYTNTDDFTFLSYSTSGTNSFDGYGDELGIWNKVLTQSEITALYNTNDGVQYPF